jgi:PAS domain S-box-containing protein
MATAPDFDILHMLTAIPVPAWVFDLESRRFLGANAGFEKLLGYSNEELQQMTIDKIRPAEDVAMLERAVREEPPEGAVEWRYVHKSGELIDVQIKYRNSEFLVAGRLRRTRLVVITGWESEKVRKARDVFE